nr:SGNH hydrolase-type esterase domain-containing protein [Tanacetum cinerariifolium]
MTHGIDADIEYDPSNVAFAEWIALKFSNHSTMDWYMKNVLWMYWIVRMMKRRAGKSNEKAINDEREPMNDHDIDDFGNDLVQNNARDYANEEEEPYKERGCNLLRNPYEVPPTCKIESFEVIKYSFEPAKEFVTIKECGYNDWIKTKDAACHAYRDIFTKIDKEWYVTRAE